MSWLTEVAQHQDELIKIRRFLHQHPELSFQEENTKNYIADYLAALNIPVTRDVGGNGLLGYIKGGRPGPTVAFRADFDALPIDDEKDVPYRSTMPGVMHACGHDGHTAMLLITARILKQHEAELAGNIVLIHQHAEEVLPGGAQSMIKAGALDGVDYVFGTHTASYIPTGTVGFCPGPAYANADAFKLHIQGKGGHGAAPHETNDAIIAASSLITQFQTIISRSVNPMDTAVVTIGEFKAGTAFNVIADSAYLSGTVRTYTREVKTLIKQRMAELIHAVEIGSNVSITLDYTDGYPALFNPEKETAWVKALTESITEVDEVIQQAPSLGGEDFSYFLAERPGTYFYTGVMNEAIGAHYSHHHPKFDLDENGLLNGVRVFLKIAENMDQLTK
ncbi:M20 metallopeptidase family protein [Macrococcus equipercicus]|uniref:Amidohydrolase n=1 Tax=Macrococcus equipercicus TaxID=69967 RepID=A0A9Q9BQA2_9STAP|nr:amidohydrolase [Macrococcus equipercicus]KAA1039389.1 amidohydrolase [Macrococcus equipercicus]UTH13681.1 amidohydrolase [Macrococcus equipercicus]